MLMAHRFLYTEQGRSEVSAVMCQFYASFSETFLFSGNISVFKELQGNETYKECLDGILKTADIVSRSNID
jgi:hypothetical protein